MESEICYHSLERFSEVKDTLGQIFTELEDTLKRAKSLHLGNKPEFKGKVKIDIITYVYKCISSDNLHTCIPCSVMN